jgi:hypothetical protein
LVGKGLPGNQIFLSTFLLREITLMRSFGSMNGFLMKLKRGQWWNKIHPFALNHLSSKPLSPQQQFHSYGTLAWTIVGFHPGS